MNYKGPFSSVNMVLRGCRSQTPKSEQREEVETLAQFIKLQSISILAFRSQNTVKLL